MQQLRTRGAQCLSHASGIISCQSFESVHHHQCMWLQAQQICLRTVTQQWLVHGSYGMEHVRLHAEAHEVLISQAAAGDCDTIAGSGDTACTKTRPCALPAILVCAELRVATCQLCGT